MSAANCTIFGQKASARAAPFRSGIPSDEQLALLTNDGHNLVMPRRSTKPGRTDTAVIVQVAELKSRLSEYIRVAEAGRTVVVTAYGRPVVDLVPHRAETPVRMRPATRAWGSVKVPRTGKGRTDSLALLVEDRRKR
jgi:prevent-host-death family protein